MAVPQADRIAGPIAGSPAVWLNGNRRQIFQPENDLGPVADSLKLENVSLIFKLTQSQQADLASLLAEQQNPSSPLYHQWLTPEQYADRYGLSPADLNKVAAWLTAQDFEITQTARGRNWVSFSGTAAQVRAAFQTEIHRYSLQGQTYFANASDPAVPAAIADVVMGVHGLDNYPLRPRGVFHQVLADPKPNFSSAVSGNTYVTPNDFAIIYDVQSLYSAGIDGAGQSVAVMGQTDLYNNGSDIAAFRAAAGLAPNPPQVILIPGANDPGVVSTDIDEASLDVEWAGAVARNATIIFVNGGSGGVFNAFQYAVDNKTAPVISISYGNCEQAWQQNAEFQPMQTLTQEANSKGVTIVAASGDSGAADCDYSSDPNSPLTIATKGLAVDFPASSPFVTGMGGSEFNEGSGNYWQAATASTGDILTSALSYIPEMAWNDTSSPQNTTHAILAGGGGVSVVFPKPSWQTGTGVPNDRARDVPDLSLNASPAHDPYLICVQGKCANGFRNTDQTLSVAGGTSMAAPTFAGVVALINQQMNTPGGQGNVNSTLYPMAQSSPAAFHDIVSGNNIVPCQVATSDPGCPAGGEMGYSAGVGYDQATGLGSIDAFNLVTQWGSSTAGNLPAPTLTLPTNGQTGVSFSPTFNWTAVAGNNGYRIMIAASSANLPTNPATSTCSACTVVDTSTTDSYTPPSPLAAGTYFWQVQAIEPSSSSGTAAWSTIFSFTTGTPLPAPTLNTPATNSLNVALPPTFSWTAVNGSAGYRILVSAVSTALPTSPSVGACSGCALGTTTTSTSYTPSATALLGGTVYYWEVQALASSGGVNGTWSNASVFTTVPSDFSLSASPNSLSLSPGSDGTSTLTLTPVNNFNATPTFTCVASSSLAGVECSVGAFSNDSSTISITVTSSAGIHHLLPPGPRSGHWWIALLSVVLLALIKLRPELVGTHPWNLRHLALSALIAAMLVASLSCGGGSNGGGGGQSSTPESGSITITGTSGSLSHSTTISLSVT